MGIRLPTTNNGTLYENGDGSEKMNRKNVVWWLFIGLPILAGSISIIIAGYTWNFPFLTGGITLIIFGIIFQAGYREMERRETEAKQNE